MDIKEIRQLVDTIRVARISELSVTADGATVRLRKPLPTQVPAAPLPPSLDAERVPIQQDVAEPAVEELYINAPMVGIFHSAGNAIASGVAVKAGQSVGAIESMKLMNDVVSEQDGIVADVIIEDGLPVEYGQPLFRLEAP